MADGFHFLRPLWLLALPLVTLLFLFLRRLTDPAQAWRGIIDPHLLEVLLVRRERRRRVRPLHLLGVTWLVGLIALAGPAWRHEPAPFAQDTAALAIVIEVSGTMSSEDIQPSRIQRAGQKVSDLITARPDIDCALFAYAASAHRVMPLSSDGALIATFARALSPEVMPAGDGDAADAALTLANAELRRAGRSGSIVLVSDGIGPGPLAALEELDSVPVHVLAVGATPEMAAAGAPPPDFESLRRIAHLTDGSYTLVTPDSADVTRVAQRAQSRIGSTAGDESGASWKDEGYWLVPLVALLVLAWSRRGWVIGIPGSATT